MVPLRTWMKLLSMETCKGLLRPSIEDVLHKSITQDGIQVS